MTGLSDTDIRLDDNFQLTAAATGDAPLCSGRECLFQVIAIEAATQKGDVFFDTDFGWSLYDFVQSEDDDLTRLEIEQRVYFGLQKYDVITPESIGVSVNYSDGTFLIKCSFKFTDGTESTDDLTIVIDAVSVEVVTSD